MKCGEARFDPRGVVPPAQANGPGTGAADGLGPRLGLRDNLDKESSN